MIHGTEGIFTDPWRLIFMANVDKYTSPMDAMGKGMIRNSFYTKCLKQFQI